MGKKFGYYFRENRINILKLLLYGLFIVVEEGGREGGFGYLILILSILSLEEGV